VDEAFKGLHLTFSARFDDNIKVDGVWVEYWFGDRQHLNTSMTIDGVYILQVTTPRSPGGDLHYRFSAVDDSGNWAVTEEGVVSLVNSPPAVDAIPFWDVVEEETSSLDLSPYISDANDPPASLTVTTDSDIIAVDGVVLRVLLEDWMPEVTINITVSDDEDEAQATITMRVQNVNDPPDAPMILFPKDGSKFRQGEEVILEASYHDVDTAAGQVLTIIWTSDRDGEIGRITSDAPVDVSTRNLSLGRHRLTVIVDDGEENRTTSVKITVYEEDGSDDSVFTPATSVLILVIVILLILGAVTLCTRYRERDAV